MANIPVAPFYVPKPSEDQLWSSGPLSNRGIIDLCTTQLKWYGAPGQVPTKRWNSFYTDNDASVWNWPPQSNRGIIDLCTTQLKWYGAPGQVPTKRWNISYTFDDPPIWIWPPQPSDTISLLTFQKFFNAGGQVPSKRWNSITTFDDPAVWNSKPIIANTPYPAATIVRAPFYAPSFDHTIGWSLTIRRDMPLNTVSVSPFINRQSSFYADDPSLWQGSPVLSKLLSPLLTAAGQVKSQQWIFGYDDPAYWVGKPFNVASPIPMLTVGGIIKAPQWHWDNDDPAMWSGWTNRNLVNITTVFVPPTPFALRQSQFTFDDPPVWNSKPISVNTPYPAIIIRAPFYAPSFDHTIGWAKGSTTKFSGLLSTVSNPFIPLFWYFNNDDPPPWQQPKQRSIALPFVPSIVNHWRMDIPDDQPWSLSIRYNLAGNTTVAAPFTSRQYQFAVDDPSIWQQPTQRSISLPFVPSIVNHWKLDVLDDQPWSITIQHDLSLTAVVTLPFTNRQIIPFDDQLWSYSFNRNAIGLVTPVGKIINWNFNIDDGTIWQPIKLRGISLQMVPAINNRWPPNTFDDLPWSPTKRLDLPMQVFTFVPPAFTSRQPTFAFDDQSSYQWLVKSSLILSLKWNINFERIANTASENRIVNASVENRTAQTAIENRIANTTDEDNIP